MNIKKHLKHAPRKEKRKTSDNSGFKKLAVQWLNEVLCFVSSSVLADSFVLRNRQLLKPANRYITLQNEKKQRGNLDEVN